MFLKKYKPMNNSLRHRISLSTFNLVSKKNKKLTIGFVKNSGKNNTGLITVRHKHKGVSSKLVLVDFKRNYFNKLSVCVNITKTPNRTPFIALLKYSNGTYSYILAPHGIVQGAFLKNIYKPELFSGDYKVGYSVLLKNLPIRSIFFNLEVKFGRGGQIARSAGTYCALLVNEEDSAVAKIRIPSGKKMTVLNNCYVTLGRASNILRNREIVGKAGRSFLKGKKSSVRGVAMNPVDHPHGGRTKTNSPEVTPWGKIAKRSK